MVNIDKSEMTTGQKAAHKRKWRNAQREALKTAKNAKTFCKYKLSQKDYRVISFDTKRGYEYKGIVDLLAVKRDKRNPDLLKIILIQVKGGSAKVTADELKRLDDATKRVEISWNAAEKPGKTVKFRKGIS
jgi:hypothetical protein